MSDKTPISFVTGDAELGAELYSVLATDFDVTVESDAVKALDGLENRRPLALIVDENIKPIGGMKFLERAGGRLGKQMMPSLLLISKQQETFVQKTAYLGEAAYMIKPIQWNLLRTVRLHINWNKHGPDLKEDLAHLFQDIKRRICGVASA